MILRMSRRYHLQPNKEMSRDYDDLGQLTSPKRITIKNDVHVQIHGSEPVTGNGSLLIRLKHYFDIEQKELSQVHD